MAVTWPLTRRGTELTASSAAIRSRRGPRGPVLSGAAGVGKTRLPRESLADAEQRAATTRSVARTECARTIPLGAFALVMGPICDDAGRVAGSRHRSREACRR